MDNRDNAQGEYYRAIAREFLRGRGAPYFLSPRDLELIAEWEKEKIPLTVVLEGISAAFERRKGRAGRGERKVRTLSFCSSAVETAHAQHRDRKAGGRRPAGSRAAKIDLARKEASRFLRSIPGDLPGLRILYERGVGILETEKPDEAVLEELDEKTDQLIWTSAGPGEKDKWRRTARREFPDSAGPESEEIARSLLVKAVRTRRRIPYLSVFFH
jgi:hypothetical protein